MTFKTLSYKILIVLILLLALPGAVVSAQQVDGEYVNGHNVTGKFYAFYHSVPDSLRILGYPITEAFEDQNGKEMQYFQRGRLEVENGEVVISDLGNTLYDVNDDVITNNDKKSLCEDFGTGFNVCYDFLVFYKRNNGEKYFGKPISPRFQIDENMPTMQYFDNVRMEYHPNNPPGEKIVFSELGRMAFDMLHNDPSMLYRADINTNAPIITVNLQTHAFVKNVLAQPGTDQTIYVIVQDDQFQPIENAIVYATLHYPNGNLADTTVMPITDGNGVSIQEFKVPTAYAVNEIIQMDISVEHLGKEEAAHTTTWFRIWW